MMDGLLPTAVKPYWRPTLAKSSWWKRPELDADRCGQTILETDACKVVVVVEAATDASCRRSGVEEK